MLISAVLTAVIVVISIYLMYVLLDISARRLIRRNTSGWIDNDDLQAVGLALALLSGSKKSFYVFDDGDSDPDSTYHNEDFIRVAEGKMRSDPSFKIRCFFNKGSEDLIFIKHFAHSEFSRNGQIELFRRKGEERPDGYHCKIADDGMKGTISQHPLGDKRRRFKEFSCEEMPWPDNLMAKRIIMKEMQQDVSLFEKIGGE